MQYKMFVKCGNMYGCYNSISNDVNIHFMYRFRENIENYKSLMIFKKKFFDFLGKFRLVKMTTPIPPWILLKMEKFPTKKK